VAATGFLCRALWSTARARGLAWSLLVINPLLLVFFGYVESYPLLLALQSLFALALIRSRGGRWLLAVPGVVLGSAAATHIMALAWMPALVVAAWTDRPKAWRRTIAVCLLALLVSVLVAAGVGSSPRRIAAEVFGERGIAGQGLAWVFSLRHLLDLLNLFTLLLAPAGILFATALAARGRGKETAAGPEAPWPALAALLPGPLLVACFVQPRIGGARDWDLFLPLVLPVILLAVQASSRRTPPDAAAGAVLQGAGQALGLAAVATAAWIAVGLQPARSARRLEVLQRPHGTFSNFARGYANETLGIYHRDKEPAAAREAWVRATQANPSNARYFNNLGVEELRRNNVPGACIAFRRAKALGMEEYVVLFNVANCERRDGDLEAAEKSYGAVIARWPGRWEALGARGLVRVQLGRAPEAMADLEAALRLAPREADIHHTLGLACRALGRIEDARAAWQRTLELDPAHPQARQNLAELDGAAP
jgi:Tfp pilus assembly protein PilF